MREKREGRERDENEMKIMEGLEFKAEIVFLKKKIIKVDLLPKYLSI